MTTSNNPRYAGKPMLRLAECYVLHSIGELAPAELATLKQMEPTLAKTLGHSGTWDEIVGAALDFPDEMPVEIREMWEHNKEIAKSHGVVLEGQQFAEMFVDENL